MSANLCNPPGGAAGILFFGLRTEPNLLQNVLATCKTRDEWVLAKINSPVAETPL